jgi:hypothetical protein
MAAGRRWLDKKAQCALWDGRYFSESYEVSSQCAVTFPNVGMRSICRLSYFLSTVGPKCGLRRYTPRRYAHHNLKMHGRLKRARPLKAA